MMPACRTRQRLLFEGAVLFAVCTGLVFGGCNSSSGPPADTTPPSAPTNLVLTVVSGTQINLAWTASTDNVGVTGYKVERCQGGGCSNFAQIGTTTNTTYSDTGLTASTSYSYRVRATDAAGNLSGYSNVSSSITATSAISVSITPVRGGAVKGQSVTFNATVQNDVGAVGVTWATSGGAFSSQNKTSATLLAPNATGNVTIKATSVADNTKSASATIAITDLTGVTTYHNDVSRDGANTHEFALLPSNISTSTFGKLFSCSADGAIYAQPLWVANVSINGVKHNVVIVATMHDSVYAFDADSNASPCVPLWQAKLLDSAHGGTAGEQSVPSGPGGLLGNGYGDITPETGVTGTPVIDPSTNTIYAVSKSVITSGPTFFQRLHALDLTTGNEKFGGPTSITTAITFPGDFDGGTTVAFDPRNEGQRPGLALVNGVVYVAWASHEDHDEYHGWVMGFSASTLQLVPNAVFNSTPNNVHGAGYARGGVWMGGGAAAADSNNNLYFLTGNGTFDADSGGSNYGDSTIKLSTGAGLSVADWFTPADQANLDGADTDHGSGGAAIIVNTPNGNYVVGGGKEGNLFLLNQASMGHYGANFNPFNSNAVQVFYVGGSVFSTAAFWNNSLYIAPTGAALQAYPFDPVAGMFKTGNATSTNVTFGVQGSAGSGATPSVSSNGTSNGIVWAMDSSQYCTPQSPGCGPTVLHAFDATKLSSELWNSSMLAADKAGFAVKFTVPTIANGKVYIGTRGNDTDAGTPTILGELDVYGLKPN
jgi:Fibronectin type III domain